MRPNMIPKFVRPFLLLAVLAFFPGCKKDEPAAAAPPEVQVVAVQQLDVPIYRDWVGSLEGEVNATISAQVSGYLLTRNYQEGSLVTNGQVLFQIDDRTYKAALDQAEAKLGKTELDVKRYTPPPRPRGSTINSAKFFRRLTAWPASRRRRWAICSIRVPAR